MLIQDTSVSGVSPNSILIYLRVQKFDRSEKDGSIYCATFSISLWRSPRSSRRRRENPLVSYLPLRLPLSAPDEALIQPHRTTIIDVTLLRLPAPEVYQLIKS